MREDCWWSSFHLLLLNVRAYNIFIWKVNLALFLNGSIITAFKRDRRLLLLRTVIAGIHQGLLSYGRISFLRVKIWHPESPGNFKLELIGLSLTHAASTRLAKPIGDHIDLAFVLSLLLVVWDLTLLINTVKLFILKSGYGLSSLGKRVMLGFNWLQFTGARATWWNGLARTSKSSFFHHVGLWAKAMASFPLLWLSKRHQVFIVFLFVSLMVEVVQIVTVFWLPTRLIIWVDFRRLVWLSGLHISPFLKPLLLRFPPQTSGLPRGSQLVFVILIKGVAVDQSLHFKIYLLELFKTLSRTNALHFSQMGIFTASF